MKLLHYAFLVIVALGALSFSVEASGMRVRIVDPESYEYKRETAVRTELLSRLRLLKDKSPFLYNSRWIQASGTLAAADSKNEEVFLCDVAKVIHIAEKIESKKEATLRLLRDKAPQGRALESYLERMNPMFFAPGYGMQPDIQQASRNWAKFLALDSAEGSSDEDRVRHILEHFDAIAPKGKPQDESRDFEEQLLKKVSFTGFPDKDFLVQSVLKSAGLPFAAPSLPPAKPAPLPAPPEASTSTADSSAQSAAGSSPEVKQASQSRKSQPRKAATAGSKKDAAPQTQAPKEDKKESKSIVPQVVRNNPLYFGLGSATAVFVLWFAKIKADYDKNPPVDESGEIIPFNKHVLSELASFDYTKMNFWIKATALGLAGAGIYGSWVNAQAA